ncbi:Inorganic phosphate transport protein PHO88 [Choanephora cucurbitarum]|uniref:Inorganic phosphate transport protein PHO88 n=1 Tax=Choanephora cucurbitarum TaxID=101091 RepID=A0A1C7NHL5_9FUNG|nr:Inorganic phosphate transport protein PHO88 [Choanephora cucurbitarum]
MTNYYQKLNSPYFNVASFLFFQQLGRFVKLENYTYSLRILYITAQLTILGLNYYLISKIKQKNDQTVLKYVEPASQSWDGSEAPDRLVNTTVMDYDIAEVNKGIKQSAGGILMIALLHFKFGFIQPLLVQSILGFKTFLMTKEARIHLWGSPATGDLRRPFRIDSPFGMISEKKQPRTDKGSIKKAEKALKAE